MASETKWILLVDDEQEILDSVRELLLLTFGEDKLRIIQAQNGMDATSKVKNQKFDCIITDMKMPKKEGDAFIVSVRQTPFNEDTPVVMLTGFPNEKILSDFRFLYLLEKPFNHDQLIDLVSTQLKMGNKGDRLAADMVNNIINASKMFLTTALGTEEFEFNSPVAKKLGEPLATQYVSLLNMFDKGAHNSFYLLVSDEDLLSISSKMKNLNDTSLETIAYALGQAILSHAMKSINRQNGLKASIVTLQGQDAAKSLESKRGIMIPMVCEGVNLRVLACGEQRKKSA